MAFWPNEANSGSIKLIYLEFLNSHRTGDPSQARCHFALVTNNGRLSCPGKCAILRPLAVSSGRLATPTGMLKDRSIASAFGSRIQASVQYSPDLWVHVYVAHHSGPAGIGAQCKSAKS